MWTSESLWQLMITSWCLYQRKVIYKIIYDLLSWFPWQQFDTIVTPPFELRQTVDVIINRKWVFHRLTCSVRFFWMCPVLHLNKLNICLSILRNNGVCVCVRWMNVAPAAVRKWLWSAGGDEFLWLWHFGMRYSNRAAMQRILTVTFDWSSCHSTHRSAPIMHRSHHCHYYLNTKPNASNFMHLWRERRKTRLGFYRSVRDVYQVMLW